MIRGVLFSAISPVKHAGIAAVAIDFAHDARLVPVLALAPGLVGFRLLRFPRRGARRRRCGRRLALVGRESPFKPGPVSFGQALLASFSTKTMDWMPRRGRSRRHDAGANPACPYRQTQTMSELDSYIFSAAP